MAIFAIKGIFIFVLLDKAEKIGSSMCEDGQSTFAKIAGGVGALAGGAMKFTPIGGITRNLTGMLGGVMKNGSTNLRTKGGVQGWLGDKMYGGGLGLMKKPVNGKSFADDMNDRMKTMKESENEMDEKSLRERKINRLGVGDKNGNLDLSKIDKFVDVKTQGDFEKYKRLTEKNPSDLSAEEILDMKKTRKDLIKKSSDDAIFKDGIQQTGSVMSFLSPQSMADKSRMDEDRETKKEIASLNKKKLEEEKNFKKASEDALDKKDGINTNITNSVNEIKTNGQNIEATLQNLEGMKDEEKTNLREVGGRINDLVNNKNSEEANIELMNNDIERKLADTVLKKNAMLKNGVPEKVKNALQREINLLDSERKSMEKNISSSKEKIKEAQSDIKDEVKKAEQTMKDYKDRENSKINTDVSYKQGISKGKIASFDKKIQGVKASQEKADVTKKTVSEEQRT
jgi:hypothetical protein